MALLDWSRPRTALRSALLLAAVVTVFFTSYAVAREAGGADPAPSQYAVEQAGYYSGGQAEGSACACCGGSQETVEGETVVEGDVQRVDIAIPSGYSPNVVRAKAGIPIEMTFAQSGGCTAEVLFPEFGIYEDLTQGPVTVALPALEPGTYEWSCGMQMVFGALVVE